MWRFWFLALTSQLTVAKRLALSANDKEWKFSFLYLSSLILNKPSLKFPYLSCGIQLCWPARLKKITKFELNNIWKSETPAPVVLYLSSSFQASFIPAELWKENFPLLPFNYAKKIKISFLNPARKPIPPCFGIANLFQLKNILVLETSHSLNFLLSHLPMWLVTVLKSFAIKSKWSIHLYPSLYPNDAIFCSLFSR